MADTDPCFADLPRLEQEIIYYIHEAGPAWAAKLAKRLNADPAEVRDAIDSLQRAGLLERVTGSQINYRLDKRTKVSKHRNHTYYALTRPGRHLMRRVDPEELAALEVNLRPPYKQA